MPNFQPSSVINFTGSIAGSPASNVASNAFTSFNDTISFRDGVIPNGTLNAFSPNAGTATQDGNVVVNIDYTYTNGARVADYYIIFYKQGGGTVSPSNPCIIVNASSGVASSATINVVPGSPYTFAFSSARVTKDGVKASSPQNQTARTMIAGNYTANIAGISAAAIASAGKVVSATIDKQAINYSVTGVATPTSINITATTQNITTPYYTFYRDIGAGFVEIQARSTDNSLSAYSGIPPVNTAYQFKVEAHEGNVATVAASDFVTVYGLASGSNALTTILSNESHSIPADSTGSPTSYAGSGTTIRLYEGSTELTYVASAPAAGQWTVIASPTNITTGSFTATLGYLTVGNHSAITSSTASIDYNISGNRQNGTAIPSFKRIQSLVKTNAGTNGAGGSPAQYIVVTGDQAFRYSSDSTTSVPAQITLSAELYGGLTTYDWQYYNTTNSAWSPASVTTQTYTVSPATAGFTGNSFRVRCVSGAFTDEITLVKLFDGTNAKVGYLTNEAFVSTTNSSGGSPVYDGSNGVFKVFNGITDISTGAGTSYGVLSGTGTPSPVASVTRNGLTLAIGAATGIYSPSGAAWSTNSESFTLRATTSAANGSVVIDKVFNIAKSRAGSPGATGNPGTNVATVYLYQRTTNTTSPTMPADAITYTFSSGNVNSPNTGWSSTIPSFTGTNPYLWVTLATASNSASTDIINSNEWQAAKLLSQNGTDGSPGAAGFSTAVLTAYIRSAFAPSTNPGTIVYTFSTSAWTPTNGWSKTIPSANGLPLWAVSATAFSTASTDTVDSGDWSTPTKVLIDPTSAIGGNLTTQSENLAAWTFGSASVSPGILYLDGSTQFWKVYENTTTSAYHDIIGPTPFASISVGDRVTLSANVMKGERFRHVMYLATDPWSPSNWPLSTFDLSAGVVLSSSASVADAGIFEVGNIGASKVYRIYITTVPATVAASTYPLLRTSLDDGTQLYASASPGSGFYATRVQLSKGYLAEYLKTDTTTIQNNAIVGDAFTGTTELRVKSAPSNNATIGTITSAATIDGNSVITVPITYTQSPAGVLADGVIVYYKEGLTGANSPANDHKGFSLDTTDSNTIRNVQFTLKPNQAYNFSVRAYRRAEGGRKYTAFSGVSTHTSTASNYTTLLSNISLRESFDYANVTDLPWTNISGVGETSFGSPGISGGKFLRLGNNSGDDQVWYIFNKSIPYDSDKIYRYRIRARQASATSPSDTIFFAGVAGRDSTDTQWVNSAGNNLTASQFYIAAESAPISPTNTWVTYTGYFGGTGAYTGAANSWITPSGLHPNVRYIRPLFIVNYQNKAGIADIDEVVLELVENNFTGRINGSPAADIQSSAFNYRTSNDQNGITPTTPTMGATSIASTNDNASVNIKVPWTFSATTGQTAGNIDGFIIWMYDSATSGSYTINGSPASDETAFVVKPGARQYIVKNLAPNRYYTFAVQAYRKVALNVNSSGILYSGFSQNNTTLTQPAATANFTGSIAGSPAATVASNAVSGSTAFSGTAKYRTAGAPTNLVIPTGITAPTNSNATKTIRVSWAPYVQGANQADVIGLFYRRDNNIPTYTDSCVVMNVNVNTPAYYDLQGVNPADQYSFGIAAGRRTENGIEWGLINTTYGSGTFSIYGQDLVGVYTPAPIGATISPLTEYAPDGSVAYRITDIDGTFQAGSEGIGINAISAEKYMVEAWVKQDTGTTNRFLFRVIGYNGSSNSYHDIVLRYDTGAVTGAGPANWASGSPEYYVETHVVDGITWYKVGNAVNVSPGATEVYLDFYPAFASPAGATGGITGSGIIGGGTIRKLSSPNVGFDWTAITASTVNFTGAIDGSPASQIRSGTANYRQDVSPTNDPTISPNAQVATADGNVVARISYGYSQGAIPADFILVYVKENGGTISPSVQSYSTNPVSGDMSFVLKPSTTYRFGVQAVRRTETGIKGGNIVSSSNIELTSPNYTGLIAGVPSNTVTTAVSNFNSSNDRNGTTPTAPTLTNTIADYAPIILNTDGTCDIEFNWSYTNGSPQATNNVDGFIAYVQSFNYPNNYTFTGSETSVVIPVANTSSYGYTFKNLPAHQWHSMAVRAYRVVDSDVTSPAPNTLYSAFAKSTYNNSRGITSTAQFPVGQKTHTASSSPVWNNLFQFTDSYDSANWIKVNATAVRSTTERAPDGRTFAWEMVDSGSTSPDVAHNIYQAIIPTGPYCVFKCFVKQKTPGTGVYLRYGTQAFGGALRNFQFEISPLSITFPAGDAHGAVRPLQNGWYEFITAFRVTSPNATNMQFMATRNGSVTYSGSPDIGNGLYFADLATYNVAGIIGISPALPSTIDVVGSTWYDTVNKSLKIWNGSSWVENSTVGATFGANTSNITGLSGDGINRILSRYSGGFDITEYDPSNDANKYVIFPVTKTSPGIRFAAISVGTPADAGDRQVGSGFYGTKAIKISSDGPGTHTAFFSTSSTTYNMPIDPNSRWILSAKMWTGSPNPTPFPLPVTMGVRTAVSPNTGYFITSPISSTKTWTDLSGVLNLSNDSSTAGLLFTTIGNTNGSPTVWFDGLMLEKQVGPGTTPSKWVKSSQSGAGTSAINPSKIGNGALLNTVNMNQGNGTLRSIVNGLLLGYARDGDVVSFSPGYSSVPSIIWLPGAKVTATGIPADASATYEAINLTTTGFTAKLKLTGLAPTVSPVTETFGSGGAVNSIISPSGGGANISADYVINKGNSAAEAWDDKYTYNYTVQVSNSGPDGEGIYEPGKITINGYARIASGWVQVFTNVVSGSFNAASVTRAVSTTFTLDGVIQSPTAGQYEFAVDKGFNIEDVGGGLTAFSSVTYSTAGAVTQISATSGNSALVPYLVTATGTGN